ncbi:MAG: Flp family type IVb pilin [Pseudomonadaceae bacterium]|jgi:pilus assembly protein Flp/PilA|nr:Flp family type IVb pilin [Pseudomonadaceae bacterium]
MNVKLIMMMETLRSFIKREDGASAIEYALIAGLISIVVIGAAVTIGEDLGSIMDKIKSAVSSGK